MEQLDDILDTFDLPTPSKSCNQKKRKWREIELMKERFQLERELRDYDFSLDTILE